MTKKKNWLGILVLVTAFGLVTAGCPDTDDESDVDIDGSDTPTEVVLKFAKALRDKKLTLAKSYCTKALGDGFDEMDEDKASLLGGMILDVSASLREEIVDDDTVKVVFLSEDSGDLSKLLPDYLYLVKIDGTWTLERSPR
jgi:hypothetical protein